MAVYIVNIYSGSYPDESLSGAYPVADYNGSDADALAAANEHFDFYVSRGAEGVLLKVA
jgi:hypothetical protein